MKTFIHEESADIFPQILKNVCKSISGTSLKMCSDRRAFRREKNFIFYWFIEYFVRFFPFCTSKWGTFLTHSIFHLNGFELVLLYMSSRCNSSAQRTESWWTRMHRFPKLLNNSSPPPATLKNLTTKVLRSNFNIQLRKKSQILTNNCHARGEAWSFIFQKWQSQHSFQWKTDS